MVYEWSDGPARNQEWRTEGESDVATFCNGALVYTLRELIKKECFQENHNGSPAITFFNWTHFVFEIDLQRKSF